MLQRLAHFISFFSSFRRRSSGLSSEETVLSDQERIKLKAIEIIDRQVEQESTHPDEGYKACIWGLHRLRALVDSYETDDRPAEQFAQDLIHAMRRLQQGHDSDFIDNYNAAKASMGSVISSFEYSIQGTR